MKQAQGIRRGDTVIVLHPETGAEVIRFVCTHGRADLCFEGYRVIVKRPAEAVYSV